MRQLSVDNTREDNPVKKFSFYTPGEGYVAFNKWLGFTSDSGRTFTRKYITISNVDYGSYDVNLTFGFSISGIKAFNQDTLLVYGDYGGVAALLYSTNQGNGFRLIYQSQLNAQVITGGIKDMVFPSDGDVGYAVEADRIIKTINRGRSWSVTLNSPNTFFDIVEAVDDNTVFAYSTYYTNKLMVTTNGGTTWTQITVPPGNVNAAHFISVNRGWLNSSDGRVYYTSNGGVSWQLKNVASLYSTKMKFTNDSTGYAIGNFFTIYKTTDSGKIWEPLPRDNIYEYFGYGHNDLQFWNKDQFWAGGGHGFIELTTNGGGIPLPKAYFLIDTTNLSVTGLVRLVNYSKPNHQNLWYKNGTLFSTGYNANYNHDINKSGDTITLVVWDGVHADTAVKEIYFNVPPPPPIPTVTSFTPAIASAGATITITGTNLIGASSISFGGIPAGSFSIISTTTIKAVVANGATGNVSVITPYGKVERNGFTFIPAPVITSFTPVSGSVGDKITITGTNLSGTTVISFGGIVATSFTVISDTSITAVLGTGGTGEVSVTTPGGTVTLAGFTFNYPASITDFSPKYGTTGTVVTIKGKNFTGATAVDFGSTPVTSFTVRGDTSVTAVVAASNSDYKAITITTPYGKGRSIDAFRYVKPPTFDTFYPTEGGEGTKVTIMGASVSEASSVTIGGVPVSSKLPVDPDKIVVVVGPGATGNIVVTTPYGTVSKGTFKFYPLPVVIGVSPVTGTAGTEVTITGINFDSVLAVKFGGVLAVSFKKVSSTIVKAVIGDGNSGPVSVTTLGGTDVGDNFAFISSRVPIITSFTPVSAPAGTIVNITGANFNPDSKSNTVYFGAVKAVVTKAAATSLEVVVPVGATYDYITVTSHNLTAYSKRQFSTTPPSINDITPALFTSMPDSLIGPGQAWNNVLISDLNGDGKPDIIRGTSKGVSILRNTTTNGSLSFASKINYFSIDFCNGLDVGDLDGDGRPEIVIYKNIVDTLMIFWNLCSTDKFEFDTTIRFSLGSSGFSALGLCDFDVDGKPDIYLADNFGDVNLYKNTTQGSSLSFHFKPNYRLQPGLDILKFGDFNGDGKRDMLAAYVLQGSGGWHYLGIAKNISAKDTMGFGPIKDLVLEGVNRDYSIGDMDGDGKNDVVLATRNGWSVLRNTSDTGFSFKRVDFSLNNSYVGIGSIGDIDGDGKPDVVVNMNTSNSIRIFKNTSTPGNISFIEKATYFTGDGRTNSIICDLNGDQKPEITVAISTPTPASKMVTILGNKGVAGPNLVQLCSGTSTSFTASGSGGSYQWQMDAGPGFINVNDNSNLSGTHTSILTLSNVPATWDEYQFRCLIDTNMSNVFKIKVGTSLNPSVVINGNNMVNQGQSVNINATVSNGGTSPTYQWQDSTTDHNWTDIPGATTSALVYTVVSTGNKVRVVISTNTSCTSPVTVTSAAITFTVDASTAINPVSAADYGIQVYPNPVTTSLTIYTLALSDQWQTLEIRNINGKQEMIKNIHDQTHVSIWVGQFSPGMYVAVLRKKNGDAVYLKFIKM
jgi:photosystem II stability/assembly factor-like uncharacterized protein